MKLRFFDIVALIFSLTVFLLFTAYGRSQSREDGYVIIESSGEQHIYPLGTERSISMEGPVGESLIMIEQGHARFVSSDCDDDLCVQMGSIHAPGEWAACLPNRIFLYTGGAGENEGVDGAVY